MTSRLIVLAIYVTIASAALTLIVLGHRPGSRLAPLSALLRTILSRRPVRVVIMLFWLWLGWHFLVEH